uniref:Saposin B-type domain-containing protein n=1 Tax=Syphacia muris TaxID=451379 RepID=A0A0N5A8J0_9BILA
MLKLAVLVLCLITLTYGHSITCGLCQSGLSHIVERMQNTPGALDELGSNVAVSCDEIPNKQQRIDCRKLMSNHFDEIFGSFVSNEKTRPAAMCEKLGYCP